ncbi:hypothetical protein CPC08DRAFT_761484 [Agrocybe pediades]|nr:hypothetical protein CPC08DRAFT_761484 [Agrocybe pediades]
MTSPIDHTSRYKEPVVYTSGSLHEGITSIFLFGIYTAALGATFLTYFGVPKKKGTAWRNVLIIGTITALYVLTAFSTLYGWYNVNILLCVNRYEMLGLALCLEHINSAAPITMLPPMANAVLSTLGFICPQAQCLLADSLLVWRCFYVCGGNIIAIVLPLILLLAEAGLLVNTAVLNFRVSLPSKPISLQKDLKETAAVEEVVGALYTLTAATSLVTTAIICRQVYIRTTRRTRRRYKYVLDVLISSCAVYTFINVFTALFYFLVADGNKFVAVTVYNIQIALARNYVTVFSILLTGLAPTLMIARLNVASHQDINATEECSGSPELNQILDSSHEYHLDNSSASQQVQEAGHHLHQDCELAMHELRSISSSDSHIG